MEASDGGDYMCELSLISWESLGTQQGMGVFSLIPRFMVPLGCDSKTPHCENYFAGMIAVFYVLIECMKTLRTWKEEGTGK